METPVTQTQIQNVEKALGFSIPHAYLEFVQQNGCITFETSEWPESEFVFTKKGEAKTACIAFLHDFEDLPTIHENMTGTNPSYPADYLCVGSDAGQGCILLRISNGEVLFWPENDLEWGEHGNTEVYPVARNFEDFISSLVSASETEEVYNTDSDLESDLEKVITGYRDEFLDGGVGIPLMIRLATSIDERILRIGNGISQVRSILVENENPQVRRLGLTALQRYASVVSPQRAGDLVSVFTTALDDEYPWCRFDAINGLNKLVYLIDEKLKTRLNAVAQTETHDKTKAAAVDVLKNCDRLSEPSLQTHTHQASGLSISIPEEWINVEDELSDRIPFSFKSPDQLRMSVKVAVVVRQPTVKDLEFVLKNNIEMYENIWKIERRWDLPELGGHGLLLQQAFPGAEAMTLEMIKIFILTKTHIVVASYQYFPNARRLGLPLMEKLAKEIRLT